MKTAVYMPFDNGNPGDSFVSIGCKWLVFDAFGWTHSIDLPARMGATLEHVVLPQSDIAVLAGSPWLWDGCANTPKYATLKAFTAKTETASARIALGVGASFPHAALYEGRYYLFNDDGKFYGLSDLRGYWSNFDLIVCRDTLAHAIFQKIGIPSIVAPCPAYYAAKMLRKYCKVKAPELCVYTAVDMAASVPTSVYTDSKAVAAYLDYQTRWVLSGKPTLTMTVPDYERFVEVHGSPPTYHSVEPEAIAKIIESHAEVFTARVHAAVVALGLNRKAKLFSVDSRSSTAYHLGAEALFDAPPFHRTQINLDFNLRQHINAIYAAKNTDHCKHL